MKQINFHVQLSFNSINSLIKFEQRNNYLSLLISSLILLHLFNLIFNSLFSNILAIVFYAQGLYDQALKNFKSATDIDPKY